MDTSTHNIPLHGAELHAVSTADVGAAGEMLAARHLIADGYQILARNWRIATGELRGELDLVAVDPADGCTVVCEVKTRRDADCFGGGLSALSGRQQARIRALAVQFVRQATPQYRRLRCDLIAVDLGRCASLTHVVDAW